jgi:membrane protease YdiL (CAAX protease family)
MQYKSIKGYTGFGQLGMLLLFLGVGIVVGSMLQLVIGMSMVPKGTGFMELADSMMKAMQKPENLTTVRLLQVLSTFIIFFIPAVMYSFVCHGKDPFWLGFNKNFNFFQVTVGFLIIFSANIMAGPLQELSEKLIAQFPAWDQLAKKLEATYNEQVNLLSNLKGIGDLILALLIMAFFPALFEELFFRGALQTLLIKWWRKPMLAIIITSVIFSLIHMSVYLFLSRIALGFALGLMFYETKNIWVNTIAHFLNNAIAVGQMYAMSGSKEKVDVSKLDPKIDWWFGIIAIFVLVALFRFLKKYSEKNKRIIQAKEDELFKEPIYQNPFESNFNS